MERPLSENRILSHIHCGAILLSDDSIYESSTHFGWSRSGDLTVLLRICQMLRILDTVSFHLPLNAEASLSVIGPSSAYQVKERLTVIVKDH